MFALHIFVLLLGCNQQAPTAAVPGVLPEQGKVLATVNGKKVTDGTIDALLSKVPADKRAEIKEKQFSQIKEQLVTTEVLYQQAIKEGVHKSPSVQIEMALAQRQVLAGTLIQQLSEKSLTEEALKKAYTERQVQYKKTEADIAGIFLKEEAKAKEILELLNKGGNFAELAKEHSTNPMTKAKGGDMGKIDTKMMGPNRKAIEAAKDGDIIGPLNMMGQWVLLKVKKLEKTVTPFEKVKDELRQKLAQEKQKTILDDLRKAANVVDMDSGADKAAPAKAAPAKPKINIKAPTKKPAAAPAAPAAAPKKDGK